MPRLSRSLKVTGTDTDRLAAYDFLLVIHNNHGPSRIVSSRNGDFYRKSQIFPIAVYFNAPTVGVRLEFCNGGMAQKLDSCSWKQI